MKSFFKSSDRSELFSKSEIKHLLSSMGTLGNKFTTSKEISLELLGRTTSFNSSTNEKEFLIVFLGVKTFVFWNTLVIKEDILKFIYIHG